MGPRSTRPSRGLSVALVERGDLAQGTSRWSLQACARRAALPRARRRRRRVGVRTRARDPDGRERAPPDPRAAVPDPARRSGRRPDRREAGARRAARRHTARRRRHEPSSPAARAARRAPKRRAGSRPGSATGSRAARCCTGTRRSRTMRGSCVAVARTAASYGAGILTYVAAEALRADGATVRDVHGGGALRPPRPPRDQRDRRVGGGLSGGAVRLRPSKGAHVLVPARRGRRAARCRQRAAARPRARASCSPSRGRTGS